MLFSYKERVRGSCYLERSYRENWALSEDKVSGDGGLYLYNDVTGAWEFASIDNTQCLAGRPHLRNSLVDSCGRNGRARCLALELKRCILSYKNPRVLAFENNTALTNSLVSYGVKVVQTTYEDAVDASTGGGGLAPGIRNEDMRGTSFEDNSFDFVFSNDVMEHIPETRDALVEVARILNPGGVYVLSTPFYPAKMATVQRASKNDLGRIEHILPPEYHGDPKTGGSILTYYNFGWDFLEWALDCGFQSACVSINHSLPLGLFTDNHPDHEWRCYPLSIILTA